MSWEYSPSNIKNTLANLGQQQNATKTAMEGYLGGAQGQNFDYLQNILKSGIENNNPLYDQLLGNYKRRAGTITDENVRKIAEQAAQSGFRGTSANQINQAYKNQGEAVGGVADNLAMAQINDRQNMIRSLLGLNQFEGATKMGLFNTALGQLNFNRQMNYQEDNTPSGFGQFLGSLLGPAATLLGGFGGGASPAK